MPNSSHINNPQNDKMKPSTQSMKDAPTDPTDERMEEGVEKIPVPMIRPTLLKGQKQLDARSCLIVKFLTLKACN